MSMLAMALMLLGPPQTALPAEIAGERTWRVVVESPALSFAVMETAPLRGHERSLWVWITLGEATNAGDESFRQGWINYEIDCVAGTARLAEGGSALSLPLGPPSPVDAAGRMTPPMSRRPLEPIPAGTPLDVAATGVCGQDFGPVPALTGDWDGVRATLLARMDASRPH